MSFYYYSCNCIYSLCAGLETGVLGGAGWNQHVRSCCARVSCVQNIFLERVYTDEEEYNKNRSLGAFLVSKSTLRMGV